MKLKDNALARYMQIARSFDPPGEKYMLTEEIEEAAARCLDILRKDKKGILLLGPVGSGKTRMMNTLREMCRHNKRYFRTVSCQHFSNEYLKHGVEAMYEFSEMEDPEGNFFRFCYDDLGSEYEINYYGNKMLLMQAVIDDLYRRFCDNGVIYHFSGNLDVKTLLERYGERFIDRLREMTEFVHLGGTSFRVQGAKKQVTV
jgi:DNA replication protein DnaC